MTQVTNGGEECELCKMVVDYLDMKVNKNSTEQEVKDALEEFCAKIKSTQVWIVYSGASHQTCICLGYLQVRSSHIAFIERVSIWWEDKNTECTCTCIRTIYRIAGNFRLVEIFVL